MDDKQHAEEDETKARLSGTPNRRTFILLGTVVVGTTIANVVNQVIAGQSLWVRMFVAGALGGFVAVVVGFVWFTFWRTSWCKFWHTGRPVTSDGLHRAP